jgi:hypothetical protein
MTAHMPHEPTAASDQGASRREDTPPPRPPRELPDETDREEVREFEHDGVRWAARVSGRSTPGTGSYGLGMIEAVHFHHADAPERPLREALLARGRFPFLYDVELVRLLLAATPITGTADRP